MDHTCQWARAKGKPPIKPDLPWFTERSSFIRGKRHTIYGGIGANQTVESGIYHKALLPRTQILPPLSSFSYLQKTKVHVYNEYNTIS
jgi:hypothetical protein